MTSLRAAPWRLYVRIAGLIPDLFKPSLHRSSAGLRPARGPRAGLLRRLVLGPNPTSSSLR